LAAHYETQSELGMNSSINSALTKIFNALAAHPAAFAKFRSLAFSAGTPFIWIRFDDFARNDP
jgi:hypothetical protein